MLIQRFDLACLCGLLWISSVWGGDWPQLLGPERNGISTETGLVQSWPKQGPPVLWEKEVGAGFSGPVVAGEWLILFHRVAAQEVVEGLKASTGKTLWKRSYPSTYRDRFSRGDGPRSTPVISGGKIYTLGAEGQMHCLELETGKVVWVRNLNEDYAAREAFFGVGTSPLVEGNLVLVNVGGKEAGIVALDKDTGKDVWKATDHEASYSSPVAATIDGTRFVFFFTREGLVALDPQSGAVRFSKPWRSRMHASVNAAVPLVVKDRVFLSASYNTGAVLLKVRKDGCEAVWKNDSSLSNHYNTSIYRNGYLYGIDGRQEERAQLRCIELTTGKVHWTREDFGCSSLVLAEGNLIALTEHGRLFLIEATPEAYREKAGAEVLTRSCRAEIALANGRLYARDDRKLVCWNLKK